LWDQTPKSQEFIWKERDPLTGVTTKNKITLDKYLEKKYKIRLSNEELTQPLFRLTQRD